MGLIIPVDNTRYINLIDILMECHSEKANAYIEKVARGLNTEDARGDLLFLSDALFYLDNFRVGIDEDEFFQWIKEKAMFLCDFSEEDLGSLIIVNPILLEDGNIILTEPTTEYIQQE